MKEHQNAVFQPESSQSVGLVAALVITVLLQGSLLIVMKLQCMRTMRLVFLSYVRRRTERINPEDNNADSNESPSRAIDQQLVPSPARFFPTKEYFHERRQSY